MAQRDRIVDLDHVPRPGERSEVRGVVERGGAATAGERGEEELLPSLAGPLGESGWRAHNDVALGLELRQPNRHLARPPFHAGDLRPRSGTGVDDDRAQLRRLTLLAGWRSGGSTVCHGDRPSLASVARNRRWGS